MYVLGRSTITKVIPKALTPINGQKRSFWEYVNMMFNKLDYERREKFGPNRTCAEWVLRNGGAIVWDNGKMLNDYNLLPPETIKVPKIMEIDGSNSSISHYGFEHMEGCDGLKILVLHKTKFVEDKAMEKLSYCKDTLTDLQVSECKNITDEGLKKIIILKKLKNLILYDLTYVRDLNECIKHISSNLPNCKIQGSPN